MPALSYSEWFLFFTFVSSSFFFVEQWVFFVQCSFKLTTLGDWVFAQRMYWPMRLTCWKWSWSRRWPRSSSCTTRPRQSSHTTSNPPTRSVTLVVFCFLRMEQNAAVSNQHFRISDLSVRKNHACQVKATEVFVVGLVLHILGANFNSLVCVFCQCLEFCPLRSGRGHSWEERNVQHCIWVELFYGLFFMAKDLWISIKTDSLESDVWYMLRGVAEVEIDRFRQIHIQ